MLTLLRYDDGGGGDLAGLLGDLLRTLGAQPGFAWGCVGRSPDAPGQWVLAVRWDDAGAMRRGLGSYDAKVALGPLQPFSAAGSGAFEILGEQLPGGYVAGRSDRSPDADSAGPAQNA